MLPKDSGVALKVLAQIQELIPHFAAWKLRFWYQKKAHNFSDYRSEILDPNDVSFRCEQKLANFHKIVVITLIKTDGRPLYTFYGSMKATGVMHGYYLDLKVDLSGPK